MSLLDEFGNAIRGRVHLLSLELRRAGLALGQMIALGLLAAFMLHVAWLGTIIGLTWAAVAAGCPWWLAILVLVLVHLGVAAWAVLRLRRLIHWLSLPATMRHLLRKTEQHGAAAGASVPATPAASAAVPPGMPPVS